MVSKRTGSNKSKWREVLALLALFLSSENLAQSGESDMPFSELQAFEVFADYLPYPEWGMTEVSMTQQMDGIRIGGQEQLGLALDRIPGISLQRRGANTVSPYIRGFSLDRIAILYNGVYLPDGAPTLTASPVNFFGPGSAQSVNVSRGLSTVAGGPVTTGTRVDIDNKRPSGDDSSQAHISTQLDSNRNGQITHATVGRASQSWDYWAGVHFTELGDFDSGGLPVVDSDYKAWGGSAGARIPIFDNQHIEMASSFYRQVLGRNSSLPLDSKDTDFHVISLNYQYTTPDSKFDFLFGISEVEPFLTSADRESPAIVPIALVEAYSLGRALTFRGTYDWALPNGWDLVLGADRIQQERDTTRFRNLKNGTVFTDRIWPDVYWENSGIFAQLNMTLFEDYALRIGSRVDRVQSDARAADDPVMGLAEARGATIRDNYAAFNGPEAGITHREDWAGTVQVLLQNQGTGLVKPYAGVGYTRAVPGTSQRYRAFLSALGGGTEVGNPALDKESKFELVSGFISQWGSLFISADVFYYSVRDFIQRKRIEMDPDIYSFVNADAEFFGGELDFRWPVLRSGNQEFILYGTYSQIEAQNRDNGLDLAEIPPAEVRTGVYWECNYTSVDTWFGLSARYVDAQTNPNPVEVPIFHDTDDFILWDLKLGAGREKVWRIEIVFENLFDAFYHHYLQSPVATGPLRPSSGNLNPGDTIPGPGRSVKLNFSAWF